MFITLINAQKSVLSRNFPCYPLPPLHGTLARSLRAAKPLLTREEFCLTQDVVKKFGKPGGSGEQLQCMLHYRASEMDNWLTEWWLNQAFLENRDPLAIYSSPGFVFPKKHFTCEEDQIWCAAKLVAGALEFKKLVDERRITQETLCDRPLDMSPYCRIFGTCRIPRTSRDSLIVNGSSDYIIVAYRNNFHKVRVKEREGGPWQKAYAIAQQLREVVCDKNSGPPVGLLTSDCRDNWSKTFEDMRCSTINCLTMNTIQESLFLLCLDHLCPPQHRNAMTSMAAECFYGVGPCFHSANRWFDKTIQFIVGIDGTIGVTLEQSVADPHIMNILMDFLSDYISKEHRGKVPSCNRPERLWFDIDARIMDRIFYAHRNLESSICDLDLYCFKYCRYGKSTIKRFELSPDSYIQMAIQLAFYRLHMEPGGQHQQVTTRKFKEGRTEDVRCCTEESVSFTEAMLNPILSAQSKSNALHIAVHRHRVLACEAVNAQGIDRHLMGLKMVAQEGNICEPQIFKDEGFMKSFCIRIHTTQTMSRHDGFMIQGPLDHYGYGCFYTAYPNLINFAVAAHCSAPLTSALCFKQALESSLDDMKCVLCEAPEPKL